MRLMHRVAVALLVAAAIGTNGCARGTGELPPELAQRFAAEGIVRRADDATFRYSEGAGRRGGSWDEGRASLVVTRRTILLHQNRKVLLEVTPAEGAAYTVRRDHDRVSLHIGTGRASKSWSFRPAADPEGWARDLRAVLSGG